MSTQSPRRGIWMILGAVVAVAGLVGGAVLWIGASQRRDSAIENFARAPIGCDTTLDFAESGEYLFFVESVGTLDSVRGDCDVDGDYDTTDEDVRDVEITLVDPDGDDVELDRADDDVSYSAAGFSGTAIQQADIDQTDDHVLRAESDVDDVFVIAVGRDPSSGVAAMRLAALGVALAGLLVGAALLLVGLRRGKQQAVSTDWNPGAATIGGPSFGTGAIPQGPPGFETPASPPSFGVPAAPPQPPQPQVGTTPQYGQPFAGQQGPTFRQPPPPPLAAQRIPPPPPQPVIPPPPAGTTPPPPVPPADRSQPTDWAPRVPAPAPPSFGSADPIDPAGAVRADPDGEATSRPGGVGSDPRSDDPDDATQRRPRLDTD